MYAGMRAFAGSVQIGNRGLRVVVYLDAAHQIVLAREDRNRLLGHIIALFHDLFVDHGETVLDKFRVFIGDVQIEVVRMGLPALQNDGTGNHITGRKLQSLVIAVHKAFFVAVQQICALTPDSLRDQEALSGVVVVESGGMELDQMQVPDLCAVLIGKRNAVAGCDLGVGGELVDPSDAAGRQHHKVAAVNGAGTALHHIHRETGLRFLHSHHHSVFQNGHIGQRLYLFNQLVQDLCAGSILMMEDPVTAVSALQRPVQFAVRCPVEVHAEIQDCLNLMGGMGRQNMHRLRVVGKSAGNHGVVFVQFDGILRRLVHPGNTALRQRRVAEGQFLLAQQQDTAVRWQIDRTVQSGSTAAGNNHVKIVFHNVHASYPLLRHLSAAESFFCAGDSRIFARRAAVSPPQRLTPPRFPFSIAYPFPFVTTFAHISEICAKSG